MATPHTSKAITEFDPLTPIQRVHVLLPLPLGTTYDYAVAQGESIKVGDFVTVPLGKRMVQGVVWGEGPADPNDAVADNRLRPIIRRLDVPRCQKSPAGLCHGLRTTLVPPPGQHFG